MHQGRRRGPHCAYFFAKRNARDPTENRTSERYRAVKLTENRSDGNRLRDQLKHACSGCQKADYISTSDKSVDIYERTLHWSGRISSSITVVLIHPMIQNHTIVLAL